MTCLIIWICSNLLKYLARSNLRTCSLIHTLFEYVHNHFPVCIHYVCVLTVGRYALQLCHVISHNWLLADICQEENISSIRAVSQYLYCCYFSGCNILFKNLHNLCPSRILPTILHKFWMAFSETFFASTPVNFQGLHFLFLIYSFICQ